MTPLSTQAPLRCATPPVMFPGMLFAEEFPDAGAGVTVLDEPLDLDPVLAATETAAALPPPVDLATLRTEAMAEARRETLGELAAKRDQAATLALDALAARLSIASTEARDVAERTADAVARLLVGAFVAALPTLCARHGAEEVAAVTAIVLPSLSVVPQVTIRSGLDAAEPIAEVVARLDCEFQRRVQLTPSDAMTDGDLRIAWDDGNVVRDVAAILREIGDVLAPLGLLTHDLLGA